MAIKKATEMVDLKETLIIVTADHGHTMTIGGYQSRGADIRGIPIILIKNFLFEFSILNSMILYHAGIVDNENAIDDKPYTIRMFIFIL